MQRRGGADREPFRPSRAPPSPALRVGPTRHYSDPWSTLQVTGFGRAPVQIRGLEKENLVHSEGWWSAWGWLARVHSLAFCTCPSSLPVRHLTHRLGSSPNAQKMLQGYLTHKKTPAPLGTP